MRRFLTAVAAVALAGVAAGASPALAHPHTSVFVTGLNNPRGLTFGPDGALYVAEGGLGGSNSTVGQCPQAAGAAAPYTGSTREAARRRARRAHALNSPPSR